LSLIVLSLHFTCICLPVDVRIWRQAVHKIYLTIWCHIKKRAIIFIFSVIRTSK